MSSTRKAEPGSSLRQERYCSSEEYQRGLMANLVAKRCSILTDPEARAIIWMLQQLSHEPGFETFTQSLIEKFPERVATISMLKFGTHPGRVYKAEQVRTVRSDLEARGSFPLKGEGLHEFISGVERKIYPDHYPASDFVEHCRRECSKELPAYLERLCLDPASKIEEGPWYFPGLFATLVEFRKRLIEEKRRSIVFTDIGSQVQELIDYSLQERCATLVIGSARIGKTFAAKAVADIYPGLLRYVQVPSSTDDIGFFRAIASSLGVSINLNSKAQHLRERIEETLQRAKGDLGLIFDEGHWLWPCSKYRHALPSRLAWIMTALINHDVPVCVIATPQFMRAQKSVERNSYWTSEQWDGRLGLIRELPAALSDADLRAVAKSLLPEGNNRSIELLVAYAGASGKYLGGLAAAVRRARFHAGKQGRETVSSDDVAQVLKHDMLPSDSTLIRSQEEAELQLSRRGRKPVSRGMQTTFRAVSQRGQSDPEGPEEPSRDRSRPAANQALEGRATRRSDENLLVEA
jgi:hypothetical protein